jgi:hypothetical protein
MRSLALRSADMIRALAAAAVLSVTAGSAMAQDASVFREVRIDLSGLPQGAAETRRALGACLSQNLPLALAGRVNPSARGAPVLIVRPTAVWLSPPSTASGADRNGGGRYEAPSPDTIEGEAIIGGTRVPLFAMSGGEPPSLAAPLQQAQRRTDQLCQAFAYWLARKV